VVQICTNLFLIRLVLLLFSIFNTAISSIQICLFHSLSSCAASHDNVFCALSASDSLSSPAVLLSSVVWESYRSLSTYYYMWEVAGSGKATSVLRGKRAGAGM
jgi:hypothetical protein